jgi:hypothetical protein
MFRRMKGQVSDELEKIWKEVVVSWFKVRLRFLPEGTEEIHDKPQSW